MLPAMATYLVTGATGLIGRHVLALLLERPDTERVSVLVRERSRDRLTAMVRDWPGADKVVPVVGDIAEPGLGMIEADVDKLSGSVDHVVHMAALYDITADDETSVAANVDGTRHVVELAARIDAGRLHHVSSVAVAGDYAGEFTED